MTKLATIFFAVLAIHATLARPGRNQQERERDVQILLKEIEAIDAEHIATVDNFQLEDVKQKRLFVTLENELSLSIQEIVYQLQQTVDHNQGGKGQQVLQESVRGLSNIAHSIQQGLYNESKQLKTQLKTQVQNIIAEIKKLAPVIQQEQSSQLINNEVENILSNLFAAIHQLYTFNKLGDQTTEQVKSEIQATIAEASSVIEGVSTDDQATLQDLVHLSHRFAHQLEWVIRHLQREIRNQGGEVKNVLQRAVKQFSEIRAFLEQAGSNDNSNQVGKLKNLLKTNVSNIAVQLESLVQVTQTIFNNKPKLEDLGNALMPVLARSLAAVKQLRIRIEH